MAGVLKDIGELNLVTIRFKPLTKKELDEKYERILICPYCGDEVDGDDMGCCGESRAHFEYNWVDENGDIVEGYSEPYEE